MPLALIAIGVVFFASAMKGTTDQLMRQIKKDFTGEGNFLFWILALGAVGSLGYVPGLKPVANAFLALLLIVFILAANKGNKDFFSGLITQIKGTEFTLGTDPIGDVLK